MLKLILAILLLSPLARAAETPAHVTQRASVSLVSDTDLVSPGVAYHVGLRFRLAPGWHIYGREPGDAGLPPELTWEGAEVGPVQWPATQRFTEGDLVTFGYSGEVLLASEARGAGPVKLRANWLICNNICVPEEASFTLALAEGAAAPSREAALFAALPVTATQEATGLWQALLFALLGGLILNVMPCVFPILAMKGFAIARLSGESRRAARRQAWFYTLGVLLSFAGIGLALLGLRQAGASLGWGFQFQSPVFVVVIAWVLFAVGLNLSGVFEVTSRLAGVGQGLATQEGWMGSFFAGVLAVLVATPCTAPFMGAAIAAALTAPAWQTVLVFLAMGLGLAAPTTLIAMIPAVARVLPRPGPWMTVLKQALAFPMYAASAWLVWVSSVQSGASGVLAVVTGLVLVGFAAWVQRFGLRFGRGLAGLAVVALLALLPGLGASEAAPETADRYTPQRLAELRAAGRPVFVNMTAAWCVTCLVNERVALSPQSVQAAFARGKVAYLKGDWTRQDPDISRFLREQGRDGVPLYVFYPAGGGAPVVLPQVLTLSAVLQAISG